MLLLVLAQALTAAPAPVATLPVAAPAAAQQGVVSYGPDFFAASRPANADEMVARLPGFAIDTGSGVRGYDGAAGNVLIDGQRPATKTDNLDEVLKRIPFATVERIDVIRGGAPGIDMQGKTVIANIIRKAGGGAHGLLAYADQTAQNGQHSWVVRAEGSGRLGVRSWEAGLYAGHFIDDGAGDGPLTRVDGAGKPLREGRIHSHGFAGQVVLTGAVESPLAGGQLRLNTRLFSNPYNFNETDFITLPDTHQQTEHDDDNTTQAEFGARYVRPLGAKASTELVALRQDKHEIIAADFRAPGDAEAFKLDNRTAETIVRGVAKLQRSPTLSWEAGGEGAYNTLTSQTRFALNGAAVALPAANVTVEEKRGEAFVKAVWRPHSTVTVEGAIREEGSQITSSGDVVLEKRLYFTKPRLALTWAPDADTQVRFRYERVVGQLDFGSFVASQNLANGSLTAGNPNLEPEKDWVSEVAVERHFLKSGAIVLTFRHSEITDAIDRAPIFQPNGDVFDAPANIGAGTKDEEILNLTLPLDRLGVPGGQIRVNSTWRQSEVTDPTTHTKRAITDLHPDDWDAHFQQDLPNLNLNWGVDVFGDQWGRYFRFNEIETRKIEPYVNPFVEWKPRPDWSLRFELDNITQRGFKRTLEHFAGPRGRSQVAFTEDKDPHFGQLYYVRLRKTFG